MNYNLIQDSEILQKLGKTFKAKKKTITWQEVSISMKQSNCTAKNLCNQRRSSSLKWNKKQTNFRSRMYTKINLSSTVISLNHLTVNHKDSLLKLLQKYEKMFDGI